MLNLKRLDNLHEVRILNFRVTEMARNLKKNWFGLTWRWDANFSNTSNVTDSCNEFEIASHSHATLERGI